MKKRILAMLLAGMMVFTMAPAEVFAAEPERQALGGLEIDEQEEQQEETSEEKTLEEEIVKEDVTEPEEDLEEETDVPKTEKVLETEVLETLEPEGTQNQSEKNQSEENQLEENQLERKFPAGGLERPKELKVSEEVSKNFEIQSAEEDEIPAWGSQKYDSFWDIYSSNYIYNRLKVSEKRVWDAMDDICRKYLTTNADAVAYDVKNSYIKEAVPYEKLGVTRERAAEIFMMFNFSNPQYYFLNNGYILGYGVTGEQVMAFVIYSDFTSGAARAAWTSKVKSQINVWESQISKGRNELQKAQIAHDLILKKVTYDPGYESNAPYTPYHQSAFSVFCDDYTVCAGYSKAFELLMNGAGVDTMAVTSMAHAWNKISINDSWYNIDVTWDDLDGYAGKDGYYMYFNRSDAMITGEYLDQNTGYHQMEAMYSGVVPKCTLDSKITAETAFTTGTYQIPSAAVKTPIIKLDKSSREYVKVTLVSESGADIYYTIDGVNPSSSYSRSYRYTGPFTIRSNVNLKAVAVKDTKRDSKIVSKKVYGKVYAVTFKTQGGSKVSSQKVYAYDKVRKPSNPKRSGYIFAGWYKDSKYKKAWNFDNKVTKNTKLYAKWAKKYTVKFNANKGSVKTKSKSVGYKEKYGVLPSPTRKGYSFSGWYTKKSGGSKITEKSKVSIKKTTTLYAHWKKTTVKKASISKLRNVSGKKMIVTAKKLSGVKGYKIRYSAKSSMKSAKSTSTSKTSKTITNLKKGKRYYVQVRAYKLDSTGRKVYGDWSSVESIKITK